MHFLKTIKIFGTTSGKESMTDFIAKEGHSRKLFVLLSGSTYIK